MARLRQEVNLATKHVYRVVQMHFANSTHLKLLGFYFSKSSNKKYITYSLT